MRLYHRGKPVWRYCSLPAGGGQRAVILG